MDDTAEADNLNVCSETYEFWPTVRKEGKNMDDRQSRTSGAFVVLASKSRRGAGTCQSDGYGRREETVVGGCLLACG